MLALFLGFGKRQAEFMGMRSTGQVGRPVLEHYSAKILDSMLTTTSGAVLVTYALYTVDDATVRQHQTAALIYTVPIVAYGLFRYLYLLHHDEMGQDTSGEIFGDWHGYAADLAGGGFADPGLSFRFQVSGLRLCGIGAA